MTQKGNKPLQLLILLILLFILVGIVFNALDHYRPYQGFNNSDQRQIQAKVQKLIENAQTSADSSAADYNSAYAHFVAGDFKAAYDEMLPLALAGNINAILVIGYLYEFGCGVDKNEQTAALWYYSGIRRNQYNHKAILRGLSAFSQQQYKMAAEWFRMADELGIDRP
ncbi:MAG: hypothetical protein ACO2ZM_04745 [Francisellaceae bacterium]